METSSFLTSLIVSFLIFAFLVLLYSLVLSRNPRNAVIYYPAKIIAHNQANIRNATTRLQSDVNSSRFDTRNITFRQRLVVPPWRDTSRSCFSWIYEAFVATEDQILENAGLDATIYMIFHSSGKYEQYLTSWTSFHWGTFGVIILDIQMSSLLPLGSKIGHMVGHYGMYLLKPVTTPQAYGWKGMDPYM